MIHNHTKFFGISDCFFHGRDGGKFPRESPPRPQSGGGGGFGPFLRGGDFSPSLAKKKKHCQRLASLVKFFLPKLVLLAKNCLQAARRPLSSHTCVCVCMCGVSVNSTID